MSSIAIKIENVSKQYRLGEIGTGSIAHDLNRWYYKIRGREDPYSKIGEVKEKIRKSKNEYVWALKDITLDIKKGEAVGLIGRNGAGKSTMLKILSRTTSPTKGKIMLDGKVASLLEVGTGFHPDLSGRENIFLNGAILGMSKNEIKQKFDEIVEFAGVEKYIDTPVKRYSSGMYVRLAFGVAAHLEPDILIVDEVLAVGDAEFQKKALGKLHDVSEEQGRTVIFVSHNMGAIAQLCNSCVLMHNGQIEMVGSTQKVVDFYLDKNSGLEVTYEANAEDKEIAIMKAWPSDFANQVSNQFSHLEKIYINSKILIKRNYKDAELRIVARDSYGKAIFTSDVVINSISDGDLHSILTITAEIPAKFLRPGVLYFTIATFIPHKLIFDLAENAFSISVFDGGSKYAASEGLDYGYIFFEPAWCLTDYQAT
ncbi:MAG: polysaccharide ABC transporter ATP-binding protein [Puia sp.]